MLMQAFRKIYDFICYFASSQAASLSPASLQAVVVGEDDLSEKFKGLRLEEDAPIVAAIKKPAQELSIEEWQGLIQKHFPHLVSQEHVQYLTNPKVLFSEYLSRMYEGITLEQWSRYLQGEFKHAATIAARPIGELFFALLVSEGCKGAAQWIKKYRYRVAFFLLESCKRGAYKVVQDMLNCLDSNYNYNQKLKFMELAVRYAVEGHYIDVVILLVDHSTSLKKIDHDKFRETAFNLAITNDELGSSDDEVLESRLCFKLVPLLLEKYGTTPGGNYYSLLHRMVSLKAFQNSSVIEEHLEAVKYLQRKSLFFTHEEQVELLQQTTRSRHILALQYLESIFLVRTEKAQRTHEGSALLPSFKGYTNYQTLPNKEEYREGDKYLGVSGFNC